jgi:translation initiation factor IF-2
VSLFPIKEGDREYPAKGVIEISALKKQNLEILLRALREKSESISDYLHPNDRDPNAECTVIESLMRKDKKMLHVILHWGFLEPGQWFIAQAHVGMFFENYFLKLPSSSFGSVSFCLT